MATNKIEIIKTWHANRNKTILFALPVHLSKIYHLDEPAYVILEPKRDGIFMKKWEAENVENK